MSSDDRVSPDAATELEGTKTEDTLAAATSATKPLLPDPGYDMGELIGRGGMGEVVAAHDRRIGREVAIKRMRGDAPSDSAIGRFLREARIQARLDHPAIAPVHELGVDDAGRPYFTMRRLAGVTLAQRLSERVPTKPLLRAFVDVSLAIQFAHERGVIHRDLKPANIILGDYGEVYVLDWGIARVTADKSRAPSEAGDIDTLDESTRTGDLLGTPGFMAPEQVRGHDIGPPADVYALGAILFEILAGEALHPRGTPALAATLAMPQQAPSQRAPARDIAPELDAACRAALAEDPAARPTAREVADRIQRFLDGDRDVEARRAIASDELARAREAIATGDPEARATAMQRAGRAVALDPESREAAQLVTTLIVEPPRELPAELVSALAEEDRRDAMGRMRLTVYSLAALLALAVFLPLVHVRSWTTLGITFGVLVATIAVVWYAQRRGTPNAALSLLAGIALVFASSRILGSFVVTPVLITASMLAISANTWLNARPLVLVGWLAVAALGPLFLEWVGVFRSTWEPIDGGVCSVSAMLEGRDSTDAIALAAGNFIILGAAALYAISVNRRSIDASHKLFVQAWHLGHLVPAARISVR